MYKISNENLNINTLSKILNDQHGMLIESCRILTRELHSKPFSSEVCSKLATANSCLETFTDILQANPLTIYSDLEYEQEYCLQIPAYTPPHYLPSNQTIWVRQYNSEIRKDFTDSNSLLLVVSRDHKDLLNAWKMHCSHLIDIFSRDRKPQTTYIPNEVFSFSTRGHRVSTLCFQPKIANTINPLLSSLNIKSL